MRNTILKIQSITGKLLLVLIIGLGSLVANSQSIATLKPDVNGLCPGDIVIVPIRITGTHVGSMSIYLDFDRTVLKDPTLVALPYYQNTRTGWSVVHNWSFSPTTQSVDIYCASPLGENLNNDIIVEMVYLFIGGPTPIHIRKAPLDPIPVSGIWDNFGANLTPWTFTDNIVTGSYPVVASGVITGASTVCQNTNGNVYTVAPIANATGYAWTLPSGATIVSGANTNSITVNFSAIAASGDFSVHGINLPCSPGAESPNFFVEVHTDATIALASPIGTDNQTKCINTAVSNITYSIGGDGSGAVVSGLPAGVNGVFASGVFTISGTPTVAGTYTYTVTTTGLCVQTSAVGVINVTPNSTISLTSAALTDAQTPCISTAITNITYSVGGSGTGATVVGLPAGVTGSFAAGVFTISGTPTIVGLYNYTVTTIGPCGQVTANGTITVRPNSTISLTSAAGTDLQNPCINTAITNITYAVGGSGTGATVAGLPLGLNSAFAAGIYTISGSPIVAGTYNYTVITTGPCIQASLGGTITVIPNSSIALTSGAGSNVQTRCINTAITNITYVISGSGTGATVVGLPAGITGAFVAGVYTLSGIPAISGIFNYLVTTTGPCTQAIANGTITVTPNSNISLISAAGTNAQTICINTAILNIRYAVGGSGTGANVIGLPAGVGSAYLAGVFTLSGTPTVAGIYNYTITTTGPCLQATVNGTITVRPNSTLSLTSAAGTNIQAPCINTAIANITYAVGGSGTGATVAGLPLGLNGVYAAGVYTISGSPTVAGTFNFTVTTTGPCVQAIATGTLTVIPNSTLFLTSVAGTDAQTACVNVAINNITYAVGGSGTGASVAGIPAGTSGVFAAGVLTISGIPTATGTFNYTVTTTGPCTQATVFGSIIVVPNSIITLSSIVGTDAQNLCINTALTNITYAVVGSGTGAIATGLPLGLNGVFAGGVFTISGSPTVAGTYNYIITTTGPCLQATASGTITVIPNSTLSLSSAVGTDSQSPCLNTAITNIAYTVGGSGIGAIVVGLPPGVAGVFAAGVYTISGIPTLVGTYNYTVTTAGPCAQATLNGTITVLPNSTILLTSAAGTNAQTPCINTSITNITYAVGGSGTGATVVGLPSGVVGIFGGGVFAISGTPTAAGTYNYTVSTTGPCVQTTASGTISVIPNSTILLTSGAGTNIQSPCINTAIANISYLVGGSGTGATVSGLPTGVTGVFGGGVCTISGIPTIAGIFNFTVTTTGPCGQVTATGTITVHPNSTIVLSSAFGTDAQTPCINTAIATISYTIGGSGIGATVAGLPAGVTGIAGAGVFTISGIPMVAGIFNYIVTTTGPCLQVTASGTITVLPNSTIALTSAAGTNAQISCINTPIINITYAIGGGGTGASISGLPAGISGGFAAGIFTINGTPSVAGIFNYTITTTGPCLQAIANGTITVLPNSTISMISAAGTNSQTPCINAAIANITYTIAGSGTGAIVAGLPAGVTGAFAAGVFTISGTPTIAGTFNFTITTTGPCLQATASGNITVIPNSTISLISSAGTDAQTPCINTALINITYAIGGSGSGATVAGLPAGVSGSFTAGVFTLSGTPLVAGTFNYTVTTTGPCIQAIANGSITVIPNSSISLTSPPGSNIQALCINTTITNISYTIGGSGTGATVVGLPAGITGILAVGVFTISGIPLIAGIFNYTVTIPGPCLQATATGTITVLPNSSIILTSAAGSNLQSTCINTAITAITYAIGGSGTGATVTGLPAGLTGAFTAGVFTLSGTPSAAGTFNYSVTTTGLCIQVTASGTITVIPNSTISLNSAAGTDAQTLCTNFVLNNITYAVGGSGTGATVLGLPPGITGVFAAGVFIISGSPTASGIYIYTVTTTGPCAQVTATGSITVLPNSTLTLTSAAGTDNQTICVSNAIVNITYMIGGSATGAIVAGLPAGLTGVYNAGVFIISGIPTFIGTFNYYIVTTGLCSIQASATGSVKVVSPPNIFNVTGTNSGFYCDGDAGVRLGLDNSETGMTYELLYNNLPLPAPAGPLVLPGTGFPLDYGWFTTVGQYSVLATNPAASCTAMMNDTINVVMNPIPVVDFTTNNACSGDTTFFTITSTGGFINGISTWQWDFGDGTLLTFNAPVNPVKHIYANTTTYQAILSVTDTNGCHYRVTHPVVVLPHPTSFFSFTNPNCFGVTTQFTDLCQNPPGQGYLTQWIWDFGDGSPVQTINFPPMPVPYNPTHTYTTPGTFMVTLTVSNSKGCSDTYQSPVTISRLPVAGFTYQGNCQDLATAFFDNSSPNGGGQITGWHWDFGDAISGSPNTSLLQDPMHTYSVPGPYTVTLIVTNLNGCKDTFVQGIIVKSSPLVDFTNDTACLGSATHFWADTLLADPLAIAQYLWDFGDNNTSLVRNASNTYVAPGTYTVSLTITDTAGCSNVKTHTITVHPSPVAHFTATNTTCQGQLVTFTDQSVANSAYMSRWVWDFGDGSPTQTFTFPALPPNPNTTYTYTNPGTYGVTLTVTNSDGCTHSETRVIEVLPAPVADFISSGRCVSTAVGFTDKSTVVLPQALSSWSWNFGEASSGTANTSTLQHPVHTYSTVNTFTVTLITFTANGCSDTITHDVTTQALPVVDFTFTSACMGNPMQFSPGAGMSPGAIGNWLWSFGDGGTAGTQAPMHTYTAPGTYNVTLSVTDTAGCSNVKTNSITIKPSPDASFSISGPGCQGDTIHFINTTAVLPSGFIARYLWNFGDGNTQSVFFPASPDVTHQYFNAGTFNVSLLVVSSDSCSDTYSGIVTIQPRPTAAFMHGSACQGGAVSFTDISNSNTTGSISSWAWDFGDAGSGTSNQSTLPNPSHTFNTSGTYTVLLSVTLSGGCSDDTTMQVVVAAPPAVDFTSVAGCNGDTTEFTSTVDPASTQGWSWQFGDGGSSVIPDPIHIYGNAGTYQVILTITDTAGCMNSKTKPVVVAPAPMAAFAVSSPGCSGLPVILTDLSSASGGSLGTWYWTFGDGIDTTYNSVLPTFTHTYAQPGTFTITLKVITSTGCENTTTHTVIISASPIADFSYGGTCQGQSTQFADITNLNGGGTLTQHTWNFGDPTSGVQNTSTQTNPIHTYALAGTYTVVLTTVNASGCNDSVSRSVVISPKPPVDFYADSLVCLGSTTTFYTDTTATQVAAVTYYNWDFGDGSPHAFTRNASHSYAVAGTYTVKLTIQDTIGCGNTISHTVTIHPSPVTQFVFSGVCENSPTHFTDLSIPPAGDTIVSWYWDFGVNGITTDTSTLQNPKFTYTLPATYSITLTTRTEHGCANTKVLPLQVWNTPTAWFKYTSSPCTNGLVQFQDSSWSYQGIINNWQWEFEPFQYGTGTNPSHLYFAVDSCYDVRLSVTDLRGCVDTTVLNVCVLPPFTVDFTNTNTCFGNAVSFTPQLLTPAAPVDTLITFHWDFGDPATGTHNVSTLKKPAHTFSKVGFYTVNFTSTDKFGCPASQFHSIQVLALPVAGFGYTSGSCDSTITFANTSVDTSSALNMYVWMYGDGTPADTLYVPGSTHKYVRAGDYMASLTVVNANGCVDSFTDTVTRGACIVAAYINVSDTLCQNLPVGFTDMSKCEGTISNWVWTFGDLTPPTTYTIYQPQVFHTYDTAGVYTVKLRVSTVVGASTVSDSTTRTILIKPSPLAGFGVAPSCLGSKTHFNNTTQANGATALSYRWDFGDAGTADTSLLKSPEYLYPIAGVYTTMMKVINQQGCWDTVSSLIRVNGLPEARFSNNPPCSQQIVQFVDSSLAYIAPVVSWHWRISDSLGLLAILQGDTVSHVFDSTGRYNVQLLVADTNGCSDTLTQWITVNRSPVSAFSFTENVDDIQGHIQFTNGSIGAEQYNWDFGNGDNSYAESPLMTYADDGDYPVILVSTSKEGCNDTALLIYKMLFKGLYVPNAFAPEGMASETRVWKPVGVNLESYQCEIFNSYGALVWSSIKLDSWGAPLEGWEGYYLDNNNTSHKCPQDVYVWKITAKFRDGTIWTNKDVGEHEGLSDPVWGTLTLIR